MWAFINGCILSSAKDCIIQSKTRVTDLYVNHQNHRFVQVPVESLTRSHPWPRLGDVLDAQKHKHKDPGWLWCSITGPNERTDLGKRSDVVLEHENMHHSGGLRWTSGPRWWPVTLPLCLACGKDSTFKNTFRGPDTVRRSSFQPENMGWVKTPGIDKGVYRFTQELCE